MRLSTMKEDRGYSWLAETGRVTVRVDGLDVSKRCHTADDELGVALCYARGEAFCGDRIPTEILRGHVEIIVPADLQKLAAEDAVAEPSGAR